MEHRNKLGPGLKLALEETKPDQEVAPLAVLARVQSELTDNQRALLAGLGAELRSEAGDVLTLTVPVDVIAQLAAFNWVVYLEASRPLAPEEEQKPQPSGLE